MKTKSVSYFYPFTGSWRIPTTGKTLYKETPLPGKKGDYLVDRLAEEAEKFIRDNADKPFFLMLSHYAVHAPLQGKPDKIARYEQVTKAKRRGKPAYAAMVESVDDSVGLVMKTLRELKLDIHTLVIFTSDIGETNDLSAKEPAKVAELHARLKAWREQVDADPMRPNPEYERGHQ